MGVLRAGGNVLRAGGRVLAGAATTLVALLGATLVAGAVWVVAYAVVGTFPPAWLGAVPLSTGVVAGGVVTGFLQRAGWKRCAVLGCVAAALGGTVTGVLLGFASLAFMLSASGGTMPVVLPVAFVLALGSVGGFLAGALLGPVGGFCGHAARQGVGG